MRKNRMLFVCLMLVMVLSGCSKQGEQGQGEVEVYYMNINENMLESRDYTIHETETTDKVEECLEALKHPEDFKKYQSVFPESVEIERYEIQDNQLKLYFSKSYLEMGKTAEVLLRAAVVQTLVQVEQIEFVSFYVGEETLKDAQGNVVGLMSANDFVQGTETSVNSYQVADLTLYFANADGTALVEEQWSEVRYSSNTSVEKLIVEQLMKGPRTTDARETIPKTTTLLGVSLKGGVCYVNFDSGFLAEGYNQKPEVTIYSIVNSILKNSTVSRVQILIDGSSETIFCNQVDLSKPLQIGTEFIEGYEGN